MNNDNPVLTERAEWQALAQHYQDIQNTHMKDLFLAEKERIDQFSIKTNGLLLDYSRNRADQKTISLLCSLARTLDVPTKIQQLFAGAPLNTTEKRAALHTALRDSTQRPIFISGQNIADTVQHTQAKMRAFTEQIHNGTWKGITGKPIQHVVTIGIGGSYLGPMMCAHALKDYQIAPLHFHFISSIDQTPLNDVMKQIDPETTLFIVSSKTFSTLETITNATTLITWLQQQLGTEAITRHVIAITANTEKACRFGIPLDHIFPLWDWVGGRYSIWSAIGLPLMLMIGADHFDAFLSGAHEMDTHFREADLAHNMPVILALLGIWYINFFDTHAQAIVPYAHRLQYLVPYLQQADMESNGKRTDIDGNVLDYKTGPILFGGEGSNGQHAYHQLFHQGQHLIPVDFILMGASATTQHRHHHDIQLASGLSQAQALMLGNSHAMNNPTYEHIPGNKPSNILFLDCLSPKNLGALLALYEHKIFVQSVIWNINPFDQWGVELGKQLLPDILQTLSQHVKHLQG